MVCSCKPDIEQKILERLKEQYPEGKDHSSTMNKNFGYTFPDMAVVAYFELTNSVTVMTKKGTERIVKPKLSLHFTYCPFCGVKYKKEQSS
ncbi:hypothetical protein F4V57_03760 [Acinetobacter qingfengensis]|uniref:Uncharacterized protein n=1 Tax=Acinetobacter qingfengensis TaxID=1262585 RepID=A0A1E7RCD9_9GAMM|nr:hypothetical protein [Acinetobacter qingfengensis]KAA8734884.1 hypothetical protein F4V57_03760 [Acinetobacter qingfengensis]OEY96946.1 hypothetical protein BJI46_11735 [Acinetobacter qingfengensis]